MPTSRLFILFFLILAALYAFRLNEPAEMYYDEVYHVKTAREFASLSGNTDTSHPPFGKMLMALSIKVFGDRPWAWRLPSLIAGLAAIYIFYLLAYRFFRESSWAALAAGLLALDGISITQSRIAMLNTLMFLFMLLTVLFFLRFLDNQKSASRDLFFSGVFLGLAAGTRWVGVFVIPVLMILFLHFKTKTPLSQFWILKLLVYFVFTSLGVYFFINAFLLFLKSYHWPDPFWKYQVAMLHYHSQLTEGHNYGSPWWSWLPMTRPIWYFFQRKDAWVNGVFCIGNPAVFWMSFFAFGYLIWNYLKTRSIKIAFIFFGLITQWLPWAVIGRVKFFHYFYSATPFLVLAITLYLQALWETGRLAKIFVGFYLFLVFAMFFYWYPLYTSFPISESFFQHHLWFKSWI